MTNSHNPDAHLEAASTRTIATIEEALRNPPATSAPSRGTLIARDWTSNVRDHSTSIIDQMISRLQELRATIALECDITNHRMASFVTLCEDAMKKTSEIGAVVAKLEQSRTFTEAHPAASQEEPTQ